MKEGAVMPTTDNERDNAAPDGQPAAIAAVIRDETSRFNEERALRKRLAELEAQLAERSAASS